MKKKVKIILSSFAGGTILAGTSIGLIVGLQHHTNKQFEKEENTDIYELGEMAKDFTSLASMFSDQVVHPGKWVNGEYHKPWIQKNSILPQERNGVKLSDIDTTIFNKFFGEISQYIKLNLNEQNVPVWDGYFDFLQKTLQEFAQEVKNAWNNFISTSKLVMYICGEVGEYMFNQWMNEMLAGSFSLQNFMHDTLHLQDLIVDRILTPITGSREKAWEMIVEFYWNPWWTGLDHNHVNGLANPNHEINISQIVVGPETPYQAPTYDQYDWSVVRPGDILYSANGFAVGDDYHSGHIGIVSGWSESIDKVKYLQIIEADQFGVCYCALDDQRVDTDNISILRIKSASNEVANQAVEFAKRQIGKDYYLPIIPTATDENTTSAWCCSELGWASYKSVGLDIQNYNYEGCPLGLPCEPGAMPHNILHYKDAEIILQNHNKIV